MCGIISASSQDKLDYSAIRLGMLQADDRGGHSSGISVRGDENLVVRQVANAKTFINDVNQDVKIPKKNHSFIGHTRFATQGEKNIENTHPFTFGNITGVHNGGIDNFKQLKSKYINDYRNDVEQWFGEDWKEKLGVEKRTDLDVNNDSKLLYYLIWKKGLSNVLPELRGSLALVFYKAEEGEEYMYFYRYDKPLCYGYRGDGDTKEMWIGSMKKYLDTLGCKNIKNVTEHAIYKVKNGTIITSKQQPQAIKPKEKRSAKEDFDEELEPERAKKSKTSSSNRTSYSQSCGYMSGYNRDNYNNEDEDNNNKPWDNEEDSAGHESADGFRFCAPKSAKGDTDNHNNLVLYWFSNSNPYVVYVETEGDTNIDHYDLREGEAATKLRRDHPSMADYILDDFSQIEITLEYRQEIETAEQYD